MTFHFISRAHSLSNLYFVLVKSILILPPLKILKLPVRVPDPLAAVAFVDGADEMAAPFPFFFPVVLLNG